MNFLKGKNFHRVLLFAFLGSLSWWGVTPFMAFFFFVPLLLIQRDTKGEGFMPWAILALILLNLSAVWWVGKATILGPLAATFVHTTLFGIVISLFNRVRRSATKPLAYTLLVSLWVCAEWFYTHNSEISFPWINLGNGFYTAPWAVQWYEWCGSLGGTVWILVVNLLIFEAVDRCKLKIKSLLGSSYLITALFLIALPISWSLYRYFTYSSEGEKIKVSIIQPSIDPYQTQFGSGTEKGPEALMVSMAKEIEGDVDFIIAPETALEANIWKHNLNVNRPIANIRTFLRENQPQATFITGAILYEQYPKFKYPQPPTFTARSRENLSYYYDIYNSAISISTDKIETYDKGKLVIGVEMMPFYKYLKKLGAIYINLGESFGMFGLPKSCKVFTNNAKGVKVGTAICYEAIYGQYYTNFIKKGAQAMFIISNDGWWGDTPGYKRLLNFASLRAIETRREIARSANTGISAFIDERGKIRDRSEWYEREVMTSEVKTNNVITPYVKYGDFVGRIAFYIAMLSLLFFVSYTYKRKGHLTYTNFNTKR